MSNYFYDLPTSSKRRNRYIFPSNAAGSLRIVNLPELFGRARFRVSPPTYIYPRRWLFLMLAGFRKILVLMVILVIAEFDSISESLYIVADLDSVAGLDLIKEGLNSLVCWASSYFFTEPNISPRVLTRRHECPSSTIPTVVSKAQKALHLQCHGYFLISIYEGYYPKRPQRPSYRPWGWIRMQMDMCLSYLKVLRSLSARRLN